MLDKTYQPTELEERIYAAWEKEGAFACGRPDRVAAGAKPYTIVIPPPNVTGSLHMGHALNNTIQDILNGVVLRGPIIRAKTLNRGIVSRFFFVYGQSVLQLQFKS